MTCNQRLRQPTECSLSSRGESFPVSKDESQCAVIVRAHSAVSGILRHDEKSCRFCRAVIAAAGNLGFHTCATMRFLSSKPGNAYQPPRTRTYCVSNGMSPRRSVQRHPSSRSVLRSTFGLKDRVHG